MRVESPGGCFPNYVQAELTCYTSHPELPTQIRFPVEGEHVTCCGSKLNNFLGRTKLTNLLDFRLARDQVVLLETAANLSASGRQANDFLAVSFLFLSWEV